MSNPTSPAPAPSATPAPASLGEADRALAGASLVVLGGSSGIGKGVARAGLALGMHVTIAGRDPRRLAAARAELGAPAALATAACDLTREDDVRALFAGLPRPADHVVVTAADLRFRPLRELDLADARATIDSKLIAALHVARHARIAAGGSLTFTTGVASERPTPGGAVTAAVNGAIDALVRAAAVELAPVRVNAISPGAVDTPLWDALVGDHKAAILAAQGDQLPVRRVGRPDDIARAAVFFWTCGFATGEILHVDGGRRVA